MTNINNNYLFIIFNSDYYKLKVFVIGIEELTQICCTRDTFRIVRI